MKTLKCVRYLALLLCVIFATNSIGLPALAEGAEPCAHGSVAFNQEAVTAATCTEDGSRTMVAICEDCGQELGRKTVTDPALGHAYTRSVIAATCMEDGLVTWTCSRCGDTYSEAGEAALGHDYREAARVPATADAEGSVTYACVHCGDSYSETLPMLIPEEPIPAEEPEEPVAPDEPEEPAEPGEPEVPEEPADEEPETPDPAAIAPQTADDPEAGSHEAEPALYTFTLSKAEIDLGGNDYSDIGSISVKVNGAETANINYWLDDDYTVSLPAGATVRVDCAPDRSKGVYVDSIHYTDLAGGDIEAADSGELTGFEFDMPECAATVAVAYEIHAYMVNLTKDKTRYTYESSYSNPFSDPVRAGDYVNIIVNPRTGYALAGVAYSYVLNGETVTGEAWEKPVPGATGTGYQFVMPPADVTVTPLVGVKHAVTVVEDERGTLTVSPDSAAEGQSVTVTARAASGYKVERMTYAAGDGQEIDITDVSGNRYTFTMPDEDVTVRAYYTEFSAWQALQEQIDHADDGDVIELGADVTAEAGEGPLFFAMGRSVTLNLNGWTIDRDLNTADSQGNVIRVMSGDVTITGGGIIKGGRGTYEGGAICVSGGSLTLAGVNVSGSTADYGAGIWVGSGAALTISGGTVGGNLAHRDGGGVYVENGGSFTLSGGSITGNSAQTLGGGVYLDQGSAVITGGSITGNTTDGMGGGIYLGSGADVTLGSGSAITVKNNSKSASDDNIYMSSGVSFTVSGAPAAGSEIHVYVQDNATRSNPVVVASSAADCAGSFVIDQQQSDTELVWNSAARAVLLRSTAPILTWADLQTALSQGGDQEAESGDYIVRLGGNITAGSTDRVLEFHYVGHPVILDLDGHTLDRHLNNKVLDGNVLTVTLGELIIRDSAGGGAITGGKNTGIGGGILVQEGTLTLAGGTVTGNTAANGGGVAVQNHSFTMTGGSIAGNSTDGMGGGVYVDMGTFTVTGGSITGNTAYSNGGAVAAGNAGEVKIGSGSKITVTGNTVSGDANNIWLNTDRQITVTGQPASGSAIGVFTKAKPVKGVGGNVTFAAAASDWSEFFVSDEDYEIEYDTQRLQLKAPDVVLTWAELQEALYDGGSIVFAEPENFYIIRIGANITAGSGDTVLKFDHNIGHSVILDLCGHTVSRGLTAPARDGAVLSVETGELIIRDSVGGGRITGGRNNNNGGGISVSGGTLTLESGNVSGNVVENVNGGGVYVNGGTFVMKGGSITGNTADNGAGGGVYVSSGAFMLNGGSIADNDVGYGIGGGVYVGGGSFSLSGSPAIAGNHAGRQDSNLFLASGKTIALDGALTEGAGITLGASDNGPFLSDGWEAYHTADDALGFFTAEEGYILYADPVSGTPSIEHGHTWPEEPEWTWNEDCTAAETSMHCVNCGLAIPDWVAVTYAIEGPVIDAEAKTASFTASMPMGGRTYTDTHSMPLTEVPYTAPSIDGDGRYVYGCEAHFELTRGEATTCYSPDGELSEDGELHRISYFTFNDRLGRIDSYNGPETVRLELPSLTPEDTELTVLGTGLRPFLGYVEIDESVEVIDHGSITTVAEKAFSGAQGLTLKLSTENLITLGADSFANCTDTTVYCNHAAGLTWGEHNDAAGTYTVDYLDAHDYMAWDASVADDFSTATLTLRCINGVNGNQCAFEAVLDAEVILEDDETNPGFKTVTVKAVYEGVEYTLSPRPVELVVVHLNVSNGTAINQYTFSVPKAVGKDYAVFSFASLDLSSFGLPAGASFVGWTGANGEVYGPDDTITVSESGTVFSATWASTWGAVREALLENHAYVYLYNDIQAGPDDLPLTVPAGNDARLILHGFNVDRHLSAAAADGYVIRVDGTLYINANPDMHETFEGGTIKGGKNEDNGGGIYVAGALYANDVTVSGSTSGIAGGGIYIGDGASAELTDVTVTGNTAVKAAGGIFTAGTLTGSGLKVDHNNAARGAGMFIDGSTVTLSSSDITYNTATDDGGGVFVNGSLTATGSHFDRNLTSQNGGGIYIGDGKTVSLSGCYVEYNTATGKGGGVLVGGSVPQGIDDNTQQEEGGAGTGGEGVISGGGSSLRGSIFQLQTNATSIQYNHASDGGGIFVENGTVQFGNKDTILNNKDLGGKQFDNLNVGNNASNSSPFSIGDVIDSLKIGLKVGGWASGIGGFFSGLFSWGESILDALFALGLITVVIIVVDTLCDGDDDKQDKQCDHPKNMQHSDTRWEKDHYAYVDEVTICHKCNQPLSTSKLIPQRSVDETSQVTTYTVTLPDGKTESRTVQPYTVILKPGIDGLENTLEVYRIAHGRHEGASFPIPAVPWEIDGYLFEAWHLSSGTDSITAVEFNGREEDSKTETVLANWKVAITYDSGALYDKATIVGEAPQDPNPSFVAPGTVHTLLPCTWEQYVLFVDGDADEIKSVYVFDGWDVSVGMRFIDGFTPEYIWESVTSLPGKMPGEPTKPVMFPIKIKARWRSPWKIMGDALNKEHAYKLDTDTYALQLDTSITVSEAAELDLNGCKAHVSNLSTTMNVFSVENSFTVKDTSDGKGGALSGGKSLTNGGGVSVKEGGTFTLEAGTIKDNLTLNPMVTSDESLIPINGGGVYVKGTFIMKNGTIKDNDTSCSGGGVYIDSGARFRMTGGEIKNNTARYGRDDDSFLGGGVYVDGTFEISGKITIKNNKLSNKTDAEVTKTNNVYLPEGKVITVIGKLDGETSIGISMAEPGVFTSGLKANSGDEARGSAANFFSDRDDYMVIINADGEAELVPACKITFEKGDENAQDKDSDGKDLMPAEVIRDGSDYELPECKFGEPEGKQFKEWSVKIGKADAVAKPEKAIITVTDDTVVTAVWEEETPVFKGHAILLTGQIGLQFFLELPEGKTAADYEGGYVTFEGNKADSTKQYPIPESTAVISGTDTGRYLFVINLSSIQMADKFTPTFHWTKDGEEKTVDGDAYAAEDYIKWALNATSGRELAIVGALADYGYYAQPYLAAQNGWTVGEEYAAMTTHVTDSYVWDTVKDQAETDAAEKQVSESVPTITYRLQFASTISLRVNLTPATGVSLTTVTVDGQEVTPVKSGKLYYVTIRDINATALTNDHTVSAEGASITLSPMSYVYALLESVTASDEAKNAVCALYYYAKACQRN